MFTSKSRGPGGVLAESQHQSTRTSKFWELCDSEDTLTRQLPAGHWERLFTFIYLTMCLWLVTENHFSMFKELGFAQQSTESRYIFHYSISQFSFWTQRTGQMFWISIHKAAEVWNAVISYTNYAKIFWDELKLQSSNEKPKSNLPGIIDTALKKIKMFLFLIFKACANKQNDQQIKCYRDSKFSTYNQSPQFCNTCTKYARSVLFFLKWYWILLRLYLFK